MRIDSPIITGSFSVNGDSLLDLNTLTTTGSNTFIGDQTITGSLAINDSATNFLIEGNSFGQTYLTAGGAIVLNPGYGGVEMVGSNRTFKATDITAEGFVSGEIRANNGVVSGSSQVVGILSSLNSYTGSNDTKWTSIGNLTGSYATTGSNTFKGTTIISGSTFIQGDFTVFGSSSIQYISASSVSIGTNIVTLNTANPAVRYAGISVQDSGSATGVTGSMLWDSTCNRWIYSNPSGVGYSGGIIMSGPRAATFGQETTLTCNYVAKSGGGDHLYDSCIYELSGSVGINTNTPFSTVTIFPQTSSTLGSNCGSGIVIGSGGNTGNYSQIGFSQNITSTYAPVAIGFVLTNSSGYTCGDFVIGTRNSTSDIAPTERIRVNAAGITCFACQICVPTNYSTFGNASVVGRSIVVQAGSTNQAIQFKNCWGGDGTLYACGNATAFHYGFNTYSCGDVLFIANGGNVGLSCNNPGYTLDVNGTGHFSSAGGTMLIESTQPTNSSTLKIIQCSTGGNGNTDQGLVVQTNAGDGTSNIANFYDYNNGSPVSRVRFLRSGITCFQNIICVAGQVSSEDVRIFRSAGTTTGYINFGSTGTNYLGFDGTRFSINGSINAGGATFSDTGDTCLVLRTTNSGNPRFKFCGGGGVFNRSVASDIMYFGESSDTGLYLFRGGTLMSDKGTCTSTYGFTHCGASRWGRFGMPNSAYMYLETNADAGFYLDGQTRVGGYFCASGNIQGNNFLFSSALCGSGTKLGTGGANTGYTSDGIWGGTATPNYISTAQGGTFRLGYTDNGSGLYGSAYGFDVSYKDGLNRCIDYDAIMMRNAGQGTIPFRVTSFGNIYGTSKNFRIKHPIPSMNDTHYLIHTSIEGPQADLIYRGKVQLVNGKAEVNIDLASRMTDGTFEVLCQDVQSYTTNESGWSLTKSYVVGNILHIEAQDETSTDIISWLVIGERNDDGIKNSAITDENGHVIVEELKPEEGL